jgi:hypothetical protein
MLNDLVNSDVIVLDKDNNIVKKDSRLSKSLMNKENVTNFITNFVANDYLVNSSFSLLTVGDPAFYKPGYEGNRTVDYYKRAKEIYSPKFIPDTSAEYNGVKAGKSYTTAYLKDEEIKAPSYDAMKEALGKEYEFILAHYGEGRVNVTDAQAYITLPFYRRTMISLGRWNDRYQDAYDRLEVGNGTASDIELVMQPLKPFVYGMVFDEERQKMVPVQHKNSEFLLLPQFVKGNPVLEELYEKMHDDTNPIDVVNFEYAVKV